MDDDIGSVTLETLLTSPDYFALEKATPTQRAAFRAIEGRPLGELWRYQRVREAFRNVRPPEVKPFEFIWLAAIRGAKSLLASAAAFKMAMTVDCSDCLVSDEIRIPIVSVDKDKARQTWQHLAATMQARPKLARYLVKEPTLEGSVLVRRPDGRIVEILVTAGRRAGSSLVSRWLAGVVFDECARMQDAEDAVVNIEHNRQAVIGRIRPGGQIIYPSSPFQPDGPIYNWTTEFWGKPTQDLIVMRAPGKSVNPAYWTDERIEQLRRRDPIAYRTDYLAEFADSEYGAFSADDIDACMRQSDAALEPMPLHAYVATMDPATRSNAWTLMILTCTEAPPKPKYSIVLARQWVPRGEKLSPLTVLNEIADTIRPYGLDEVYTDQWSVDALSELASTLQPAADGSSRSISLTEENRTREDRYDAMKTLQLMVEDRRLEFPRDPVLKQDLVRVRRRVTAAGIKFVLPRSGDGHRHADYVPALELAMGVLPPPPAPAAPAKDPELERARALVRDKEGRNALENAALRLGGSL